MLPATRPSTRIMRATATPSRRTFDQCSSWASPSRVGNRAIAVASVSSLCSTKHGSSSCRTPRSTACNPGASPTLGCTRGSSHRPPVDGIRSFLGIGTAMVGGFTEDVPENVPVHVAKALETDAALSDAGLRETLFMSLRDILPVDHSMDVDRDIPLLAGQSHDGRVSLTPGGVAKTIRPVADHAGDHDRSQVWDRRADELMQLLDFTSPRFVQQLEILLGALGLGARRQ